ncbi:hypothetical protein KY343_02890 [Candidatus Woesearchaeota archaeon]|nr:hypothetical protein [Candidatus Woesearchaeota archaeon]
MAEAIGKWAFLIGVVLAIIAGIGAGAGATWAVNPWIALIIVILGLVIGFVNITASEVQPFLIAALALFAFSFANLGVINTLIPYLGSVLNSAVSFIALLVGPAALVVALRAVYRFAAE